MIPVVAVLWGVAAKYAFEMLASLSVVLRPSAATDLVHLGGCLALVLVTFIFLILTRYMPERAPSDALGLRGTQPWLIVMGLALGVCLTAPAESIRQLTESLWPTPTDELLRQSEQLRHDTLIELIGLLVMVVIVGPLVEELFYRGALFGAMVPKNGLVTSVIVTSILFVFAHSQVRDYPALTVVALCLGYLRAASGSLLPCLGLHVGFNMMGVLMLVTGISSATRSADVPIGISVGSWIAVFALTFAIHRVSEGSTDAAEARREDRK